MADADPNELVWMVHPLDGYSTFPAYAVGIRKESGWKPVSKAEAAKHGYSLPGDLDTAPKSKPSEG